MLTICLQSYSHKYSVVGSCRASSMITQRQPNGSIVAAYIVSSDIANDIISENKSSPCGVPSLGTLSLDSAKTPQTDPAFSQDSCTAPQTASLHSFLAASAVQSWAAATQFLAMPIWCSLLVSPALSPWPSPRLVPNLCSSISSESVSETSQALSFRRMVFAFIRILFSISASVAWSIRCACGGPELRERKLVVS